MEPNQAEKLRNRGTKDSAFQKLAHSVPLECDRKPPRAVTEFRVGCDDEALILKLLPPEFSIQPATEVSSDAGVGVSMRNRKDVGKRKDTGRTERETNQFDEFSFTVPKSGIDHVLGSGETVLSRDRVVRDRHMSESLIFPGKKKKASDAKVNKKTKVEWSKHVFVLPTSESSASSPPPPPPLEFQVRMSNPPADALQVPPLEFQVETSKGYVDTLQEPPVEFQVDMSKASVDTLQVPPLEFHDRMPRVSADALQPAPGSGLDPDRQRAASTRRQSIRIDNKGELTKRWNWNHELVAKDLLPYKKMLAEGDELVPTPNEFDSLQTIIENQRFEKVLAVMLEDGELHEREIAAFFEGLALYDVKVKALQSQLGFLKAEKGVERARELGASSFHRSNFRRPLLDTNIETKHVPFSRTRHISFMTGPENQVVPAALSMRAISIKKIKNENKSDGQVQRLLTELEEAEKKQHKLEQQLRQAGIVIAEDIPYEEARARVEHISKRMQEIGSSDVKHEDKDLEKRLREEYFRLEQDMEKYNAALVMSDEYAEQQEQLEHKWEADNDSENLEALKKVRRCMPVNVKFLSEAQLRGDETPNGRYLPDKMAKKFKRTDVLQLLRSNPEDITRMHPSTLESLRLTGLTLTERRAIHCHLKGVGPVWKAMQAEPMTERKWTWYEMMRQNFKENLSTYQRHVEQYGPPGSHTYATRQNQSEGCPLLGNQCPLRANEVIDYNDDYGFTEDAEYAVSHVKKADTEDPGAKAMREALEMLREKKSSQRSESLKNHYKGKVLQVSLASGSCESMDEAMDRMEFLRQLWMEESLTTEGDVTDDLKRDRVSSYGNAVNELKLTLLRVAGRSGMQLTGKRDSNADHDDSRSPIELGLAEEVGESCLDFFDDVLHLMSEMKAKDSSRIKSTIGQLRELLDELHERNVATLQELGVDRPERSRRFKSRAEIKREVIKSMRAKRDQKDGPISGEGSGRGGEVERSRGNVLSAIAGRGRGGQGDLMSAIAGRGRGGQGDLMSAIAGRGRGGQGDLMSAIAGRGRGGQGDLMSAIAGRGKGGRGDLMSAIAGRGRGGRGDLMSAIAGRGESG